MTLRKVGFDVESINNEFNVAESILTYNPDYIICRGNSARLSALNVGRKLRELNSKFNGKVILLFGEGFKLLPEDLIKLKSDLLLFEPISTLRLATHLFSFTDNDFEFIRDKLLKFAITDNQFRNYEQQILKNAGITIDSEIQIISSMDQSPKSDMNKVYSDASSVEESPTDSTEIEKTVDSVTETKVPEEESITEQELPTTVDQPEYKSETEPAFPDTPEFSAEAINKINEEIQAVGNELPLRIDTYYHAIKKADQDLSVGLNKRQTKKALNSLNKDLINEKKTDKKSEEELREEKIRFTDALFKKKS